ncbi:MAG: hypothetical protein ACU833_13950 [Gammaproteobacteria bacterium]
MRIIGTNARNGFYPEPSINHAKAGFSGQTTKKVHSHIKIVQISVAKKTSRRAGIHCLSQMRQFGASNALRLLKSRKSSLNLHHPTALIYGAGIAVRRGFGLTRGRVDFANA